MSKISNVITMLELLQTGKKYSIKELSNILEVTPRMIRCYKEELEKAGIYIDSIKGIYGGYILNSSIRIPNRKFKKIDYKILDEFCRILKKLNIYIWCSRNQLFTYILKSVSYGPVNEVLYYFFALIKWPIAMFIIYLAMKLIYVLSPDGKIYSSTTSTGALFSTLFPSSSICLHKFM